MNLILFDSKRTALYPLSMTRPCAELRVGIMTLSEKWSKHLSAKCSHLTAAHLQTKYPVHYDVENCYVNGRLIANTSIADEIKMLPSETALVYEGELIALKTTKVLEMDALMAITEGIEAIRVDLLTAPYDIFSKNDESIRMDFELLTANRRSQEVSESNTLIGDQIFIEEGAIVEGSILNSLKGPIYLGKDTEIMEGCMVRGPFAANEHAVLKMGAKIYGATTLGPYCKVGGEVNNVVFQAYSNKGHDGFLGNAVIGEWCNIGADTNSSNLKNNYAEVKVWNYDSQRFKRSGLQFCGLIMGDHSKCGINTMFNTGTVVGVSANIFGAGFPRNFVPSFSWGGSSGFSTYALNKAFETADKVMSRRNVSLDETDKTILKHIFENTSEFRVWEKNH